MASAWLYLKFLIIFAIVSAITILLSPIIVPVIIPLAVILIGSLLADAQSTIAFLLSCYHRFNLLKIKYYHGCTPDDLAHDRLQSGRAWHDFCDTLKTASSAISNGPPDALSQAEGYRYLARVTRAGLAAFLEYADPDVPRLHSLIGDTIKMGADNPDNLYESAPLVSAVTYKLKGLRGTVKYLSIGTQKGHYGKRLGMPPLSFLFVDSPHFQYFDEIPAEFVERYQIDKKSIDENERYFEILITRNECKPSDEELKKRKLNWLRLDDQEDGTLIVRQTFGLRENEQKATIKLERFDMQRPDEAEEEEKRSETVETRQMNRPKALRPSQVEEALKSAASLVYGAGLMFSNWGNRMRNDKAGVNKLPVLEDQSAYKNAGGDPNIFYYHSYYEIARDEALVIKALIEEKCFFWNFQLNNHWMESLDYSHFPIHVNSERAVYDRDEQSKQKCVFIVVSHDEHVNAHNVLPERYRTRKVNWLSTAYHYKGTMLFRWLCTENFKHPTTELVKLSLHES